MKFLILSIPLLCLPFGTVCAQTELWKWKAKGSAELRAIQATSIGEDGSAAIIVGETNVERLGGDEFYHGPVGKSSYRIVWLDAKGKTVFSKSMRTRAGITTVQRLVVYGDDWLVHVVDRDKMVAYDGAYFWTFSRVNGKIKESRIATLPDSPIMKIFDSESKFEGWLEPGYGKPAFKYRITYLDGSGIKSTMLRVNSISLFGL